MCHRTQRERALRHRTSAYIDTRGRTALYARLKQAVLGPKHASNLTHVILCDKFQPCHWPLLAYVAFLALHVLRCMLLEIALNADSECVGRRGPCGGVLSLTGGTSGLSKYCNWQHTFLHTARHLRNVDRIVSRYFVWYCIVSIFFPYGCIMPSLSGIIQDCPQVRVKGYSWIWPSKYCCK